MSSFEMMSRSTRWQAALLALLAGSACAAENALTLFSFGVLEEQRGEAGQAQRSFEEALLLDPQALPLVERCVRSLVAQGAPQRAVERFAGLARARPGDLEVQLRYADFLKSLEPGMRDLRQRRLDTLEASRSRALDLRGSSPLATDGFTEIAERLFDLYLEEGMIDQAKERLRELSEDTPQEVLLYARISQRLFAGSDPAAQARVEGRYRRAMQRHPRSAALARAASEYFRQRDRLDAAIEILRQHTAAAPGSLALRTRLGILLLSAGREEEGEAALREVLSIDPNRALAHQALAKQYRLRGQQASARRHTGELLKLRGGSPEEFLTLAEEWLADEEPRQARLLLEKAVFDHPSHLGLQRQLAIATRRDPETRGRAHRLFLEAEAALAEGGTAEPDFLVESARSLLDQGKSQAAEERLRNAIRSFPPDQTRATVSALRALAQLWESEGRNLQAAAALRKRADALETGK